MHAAINITLPQQQISNISKDIENLDNNWLNRSEFVYRKWISPERRSSCCLCSQRPATNVLVVAAVLLLNPFKFSPQHEAIRSFLCKLPAEEVERPILFLQICWDSWTVRCSFKVCDDFCKMTFFYRFSPNNVEDARNFDRDHGQNT